MSVVLDRLEVGDEPGVDREKDRAGDERRDEPRGGTGELADARALRRAEEEEREERRDSDRRKVELEVEHHADQHPGRDVPAAQPRPRDPRHERERAEHREAGEVPAARQRQRVEDEARDDRGCRRAELAEQQAEPDRTDRKPEAVEEERPAPAAYPERELVRVEDERILVLDHLRVELVAVQHPRCDAQQNPLVAGGDRLAAKQHESEPVEQGERAGTDHPSAHRDARDGAHAGLEGAPCAAAVSEDCLEPIHVAVPGEARARPSRGRAHRAWPRAHRRRAAARPPPPSASPSPGTTRRTFSPSTRP